LRSSSTMHYHGRIHGGEHCRQIRRRDRLAPMSALHRVIKSMVSIHGITWAGSSTALVAIEVVTIKPASLLLAKVSADRCHFSNLRRSYRFYSVYQHLLPARRTTYYQLLQRYGPA